MRPASLLLLAFIGGCQSAPQQRPTDAVLVEPVALPPVSAAADGECATTNWTAAMACADMSCVASAVADSCVECVAATEACIDQRSSGCADLCVACLGAERCEHLENIPIAAAHLTPDLERGYTGGAATALRIGALPTDFLFAVTPDDLRWVSLRAQDTGWNRSRETTFALIDNQEHVLRSWGSECRIATSPAGTWLVESCGETARLFELRTGFVRQEFDLAPGSEVARSSFGGEQFLAIRGPGKRWELHDLLHRSSVPVKGIYEYADTFDVSVSPDGKMVADKGKVWSIAQPTRVLFEPKRNCDTVIWLSSDTLACAVDDGATQVIRLPSGQLVRELARPAPPEGAGRVFWFTQAGRDEVVWVGQGDAGPFIQGEDGLSHRIPALGSYGAHNVLGEPTSSRSGFAMRADGTAVFGSPFGLLTWSADTGLAEPGKLRGSVLWQSPGASSDELLVGSSTGAAAVNVATGDVTPLSLPTDYRLIDVRYANDRYVALGSRRGEKETERRNTIRIIDPRGDSYTVTHDEAPLVATLDAQGRLHVIDRTGLKSYDAGTEPAIYAATKQPGGRSILTRGGPPRALPSQGLLSADGAYALFPQKGKATLIRTRDHTVIRSWQALSCVFARRSPVVGCMESRGSNGEVEIITFDAGTGKELSSASVSVWNMELVEVSEDGERVMIGDSLFQTASIVVDLVRGRFHDLPQASGKRVTFHSDGRLMFTGPAYLELFSKLPPARL